MRNIIIIICISWTIVSVSFAKSKNTLSEIQHFFYQIDSSVISRIDNGLINSYQVNNKIYWEIPNTLLDRDLSLMVTLLKSGVQSISNKDRKFGYRGDRFGPWILSFRKSGNEIHITQSGQNYIDSEHETNLSRLLKVREGNRILHNFPIFIQTNVSNIIDVTDLIFHSNLFSLAPFSFMLNLGTEQSSLTVLKEIKSTSQGIIVRTRRSYKPVVLQSKSLSQSTEPSHWELGASLMLLPKEKMQVRYANHQVGYFSIPLYDLNRDTNHIEETKVIKRWRLEIPPNKRKRYMSGKLVEPIKKIVFYIDKDFPNKWRSYVKKGVYNWNSVFEKVGFKNAIEVCDVMENDEDYSLDNSLYSTISYKYSSMENAYGRVYIDPRTGEILCCHISIFHSVFNLIQKWCVAQINNGPVNITQKENHDRLLGTILESVITHEIGHALGLTHNYYGSSIYSERELSILQQNHTSSIMDYVRLNYLGKDKLTPTTIEKIVPQIGSYDEFAIQYGYQLYPNLTLREESLELNKFVEISQQHENKRFVDLDIRNPYAQDEDLSSDPLKAAQISMGEIRKLLFDDKFWQENDINLSIKQDRYIALKDQYRNNINHALTFINGYRLLKSNNDTIYQPIDMDKQSEALAFIFDYVIQFPLWMKDNYNSSTSLGEFAIEISDIAMNNLIHKVKDLKTLEQMSKEMVKITDLFWNQTISKESIYRNYHIQLRWRYLDTLIEQFQNKSNSSVIKAIILDQLLSIYNSVLENKSKFTESDFSIINIKLLSVL